MALAFDYVNVNGQRRHSLIFKILHSVGDDWAKSKLFAFITMNKDPHRP